MVGGPIVGDRLGTEAASVRRCMRALRADRRAATAVEFAMVAPILLMMTMGIIELGICFTADIVLRNATYMAARVGRTGYVAEATTRDAMIRALIIQQTSSLMDAGKLTMESKAYAGFEALQKPEPFIDANGNGKRDDGETFTDINGNGVYDLDQGAKGYGGTSEIVVYTVTYPWTFFTPLIGKLLSRTGTVNLTATAVVQNEPY